LSKPKNAGASEKPIKETKAGRRVILRKNMKRRGGRRGGGAKPAEVKQYGTVLGAAEGDNATREI